MSEYVKEVNEGNFAQVVLQSETPTLVDFSKYWGRKKRRPNGAWIT
jgi:hypothetical protein